MENIRITMITTVLKIIDVILHDPNQINHEWWNIRILREKRTL